MQIRKAIIPSAGLGTRMRPITHVLPKEMLPLGTNPVIQYALEEARDSGIRHVGIVISTGVRFEEGYPWS